MYHHFTHHCVVFPIFLPGPACSLFEKSYYQLMKGALKPGGIVCTQGKGENSVNPERNIPA